MHLNYTPDYRREESASAPSDRQSPDPRLKLLQEELEKAEAEGRSHELARLWEEKAAASNAAFDWFQADYYFSTVNQDRVTAIDCFDKAIELDPKLAYAWSGKGSSLYNLDWYVEALSCIDKALELDPEVAYSRFNRSEAFFELHRWDEGFGAIRDALEHRSGSADDLGDVSSMFSLIFRLSEDDHLRSRISTLVDLYQQAADEQGFRRPDQAAKRSRSAKGHTGDATQQNPANASRQTVGPATNPLSHLADGLVKSLAKIEADRVTPVVLQSYVIAVEQRVSKMSEFEIPLRLFRYGVRYLISKEESEFVELIKPERRILRQALRLEPEGPTQEI